MKKILIVEDEKPLNDAFSIILRKSGYDVDCAYDGLEALELTAQKNYDLLLLDLLMPKLDGKGFLKKYNQIKNRPYIIVFSNLDSKDEIDEAYALGADKYLLKSWADPKNLKKVIKEIIGD